MHSTIPKYAVGILKYSKYFNIWKKKNYPINQKKYRIKYTIQLDKLWNSTFLLWIIFIILFIWQQKNKNEIFKLRKNKYYTNALIPKLFHFHKSKIIIYYIEQ